MRSRSNLSVRAAYQRSLRCLLAKATWWIKCNYNCNIKLLSRVNVMQSKIHHGILLLFNYRRNTGNSDSTFTDMRALGSWREWMKRPSTGTALTNWWVIKRKTEKETERIAGMWHDCQRFARFDSLGRERWRLGCKSRLTTACGENLQGSTRNKRKIHTIGAK